MQFHWDVEFYLAVGDGSARCGGLCGHPRTGAFACPQPLQNLLGRCSGADAQLQATPGMAQGEWGKDEMVFRLKPN